MKRSIAWQIGADGAPQRLVPGAIALEKNLEDWIDKDVAIVADDVLVIGRQIRTSWGTVLDLLGIDESGNLVIVELKRDQTLRETVAQAIEYAAWASRLGHSEVMQIAGGRYGSEVVFRETFEKEFGASVPDTVNSLQRILVVAPAIDDTTAFIIEYLSETYRIPINAVSFDIFGEPGSQLLVRHFVIEETTATPQPAGTKTRQTVTWDDVLARARDLGIEEVVQPFQGLSDLFKRDPWFNATGWTQYAATPRDPSGVSAFRVILKATVAHVVLRADNLAATFGITRDECQVFIDQEATTPAPVIGRGFTRIDFTEADAAEGFAKRFRSFVEKGAGLPTEKTAMGNDAQPALSPD